jgi:hypothetical protein
VSKPSSGYPKVSQNFPEHRGGAVAANSKTMRSERPTRRASATLKRYKAHGPLGGRRQVAAGQFALRYTLEFGTEESSALLGAGFPSSYAQ